MILLTLDGAFAGAAKHFEVVGIPDEQHVPSFGTRAVDDTIELQRPCLATFKCDPRLQGKVSGRNDDSTARLASRKCLEKCWAKVCRLVRLRTIVHHVAGLLRSFDSVSGQRPDFAG
jgi:hypothetical protein